jgi:rubrerythrin
LRVVGIVVAPVDPACPGRFEVCVDRGAQGGKEPVVADAVVEAVAAQSVFDRALELGEGELNALTSDLTALRLAYLIERDAVAFYTRAGQQTQDPKGKRMFHELVAMEQYHYNLLLGEYTLLSEQFKLTMGFEPF